MQTLIKVNKKFNAILVDVFFLLQRIDNQKSGLENLIIVVI